MDLNGCLIIYFNTLVNTIYHPFGTLLIVGNTGELLQVNFARRQFNKTLLMLNEQYVNIAFTRSNRRFYARFVGVCPEACS